MANDVKRVVEEGLGLITKLKTELEGLKKMAVETAGEISTVLNTKGTSNKELQTQIDTLNKKIKELNATKEKTIVVDQQIKTKMQEVVEATAKYQNTLKGTTKEQVTSEQMYKKMFDAIEKSTREYNKLVKAQQEAKKALQDANLAFGVNSKIAKDAQKNYDTLTKKVKEANTTLEQLAKEEKILANEITKANKARVQEADRIESNKQALNKQRVAMTELNRAYVKLITQQKLAKKELQDSIVLHGKNNAVTKQAQARYDALTKKVNQANAATRNFAKGGLTSAVKGLRNLMSAFGITGGIYLFASALKDTFDRIKEFDSSMQNLAGIFRTTREELKPLEEDIIRIAGESIKTSREVAELAETLATLGKSPEQISKLLEPVVELGIGLETTSENAGEFLIQMLNAFEATEDEAKSYADTIATIRTSTTLDFQKMKDSFQYIAPIAKLLNKDLAYTGSIVGILADNGLRAQQAGRVLGTSLQKLATQGKTLDDALDEINEATERGVKETELLALSNRLFGAEGAKVGVVLAKNKDLIDQNTESIRNNGGALDDLVEQQMESLDNKIKVLDASWEELVLTIENGNGKIADAIKGFIETITFAIQKTTELEQAQSKLAEIGVEEGGIISFFKTVIPFTNLYTTSFDKATDAQIKFNKQNENIDANGLNTLYLAYNNLSNELYRNAELSEKEKKVYEQQLEVISKHIKLKESEKETLQKTALELGYNESAMSKLAEVTSLSIYQLKEWIKENENLNDSTKESTDGRRTLSVVLKEISDLQKELKDSTKEEAQGILSKISVLEKEKEAWELLEKARKKVSGLDLPSASTGLVDESDSTSWLDELRDKGIDVPVDTSDIDALVIKLKNLEDLKEIFNEISMTFSEMFDIDMSKFDFLFDGLENSVEDWAKLSRELIGSVLDASLDKYDRELEAAQISRDRIVDNELSSQEQIDAANDQYDEKERQINIEKAKAERNNALVKIATDMAVGIASAHANYLSNPLTAPALPAVLPLIIGAGLLQAGIVASQPLPEFYMGVENSNYEGWATKDERGAELHLDKKGNIKDFGQNRGAKTTFVERGDTIIPALETKRIIDGFSEAELNKVVLDMNMYSNGSLLTEKQVDNSLLKEVIGLKESNERVWKEVKKMASRPINVKNKVEVKTKRPY